ncbi:HepT-like ribonuclease domain-containing protein [Microcella indica]|uniref:HepT-like ribonuclease domain-containing protein n=1 Tax=Microcella indica TaxID=2750620 RepID=UPI0015CF2770|nr:HepT-like ribonuclease domain-containing protein [Microcella indica]
MTELRSTLDTAAQLAARGRAAYDDDPALRLAFEALSNRVGDLAKRLIALDPDRFSAPIWSAAARNRDIVAHHYHRIDTDLLWQTVAHDFVALRALLDRT